MIYNYFLFTIGILGIVLLTISNIKNWPIKEDPDSMKFSFGEELFKMCWWLCIFIVSTSMLYQSLRDLITTH
jgi:hypothetical protein